MATLSRAIAQPILKADEVRPLLLEPTVASSVLGQIATTIYTDSPIVRVPYMGSMDVADWIPEGEEIPLGDVAFEELALEPRRLTGGAVLTNELIDDSNPEASALIGAELARDLGRKLDIGFFGSKGSNPERPAGLQDRSDYVTVDAQALGLDAFFGAEQAAEAAGVSIDTYVTNPVTATSIAKMIASTATGGADPTAPIRRIVMGTPVISSTNVPAGVIWGFNKATTWLVIRNQAYVEADGSVFFTSYRTALRSRIRATWGLTNPAGCIKIEITP